MSKKLTHIDAAGDARMVDVGAKAETQRVAVAGGAIRMSADALAAIKAGNAPKGDGLALLELQALWQRRKPAI